MAGYKKENTDEKLYEAAKERLELIEKTVMETPDEQYHIKMEGMNFSRKFIEKTTHLLKQILNGETIDYETFYRSINLEMLANSRGWNTLRYYARQKSWEEE